MARGDPGTAARTTPRRLTLRRSDAARGRPASRLLCASVLMSKLSDALRIDRARACGSMDGGTERGKLHGRSLGRRERTAGSCGAVRRISPDLSGLEARAHTTAA